MNESKPLTLDDIVQINNKLGQLNQKESVWLIHPSQAPNVIDLIFKAQPVDETLTIFDYDKTGEKK